MSSPTIIDFLVAGNRRPDPEQIEPGTEVTFLHKGTRRSGMANAVYDDGTLRIDYRGEGTQWHSIRCFRFGRCKIQVGKWPHAARA